MSSTIVRPAAAQDREAVLALLGDHGGAWAGCSAPWDLWEADAATETFVAQVGDQVTGAGALGGFSSGQGCMDVPPTHAAFRQLGIRTAIAAFLCSRAHAEELRVLRTAVDSSETRYHRSLGQLGFHRVAVSSVFASDSLCQGAPPTERFDERQYSEIQNLLGRSSLLQVCAGLICLQGRWLELTGKLCRDLLASGRIRGLRSAEGRVDAFAIEAHPSQAGALGSTAEYSLVDGKWQSLGALAMGLRGLSAGPDSVLVRLPDEPTVRGLFQLAGFRPVSEGRETWLFELCLP